MARYIPALRTKAGEATALQHLSPSARSRIMPMVALAATPAPRFTPALSAAWTGQPLALDGQYNDHINGTPAAFAAMLRTLGGAGVQVIPTVSMRSSPAYLQAVRNAVGRFAPGLIVRCRLRELPQISAWTRGHGWNLHDVDLLITLGDISTQDPPSYSAFLIHHFEAHVPSPPPWRSVTIGASSAPKDHGDLNRGRTDLPRVEWELWNEVAPNLPFQLDYADSGPLYPSLEEPPGFAMAMATVSVRYATDDHWIVIKGTRTSGPRGQDMSTQYRAHARTLVRDRLFGGVPNCWADDEILAIAGGRQRAGNRTTWAAIGANRHISLISDRLP